MTPGKLVMIAAVLIWFGFVLYLAYRETREIREAKKLFETLPSKLEHAKSLELPPGTAIDLKRSGAGSDHHVANFFITAERDLGDSVYRRQLPLLRRAHKNIDEVLRYTKTA